MLLVLTCRWQKTQATALKRTRSIKQVIDEKHVKKGNPFEKTALSSTLHIGLQEFILDGNFIVEDEESTTSGLLAYIASAAPWCSEAYGTAPDFTWVKYKKNGNEDHAEPSTGADFALILRVNGDITRAAVFQAKRMLQESATFDVHRISPARSEPDRIAEPQFLRLFDHGRSILTNANKSADLKHLHWIHYLIYQRDLFSCVPMSDLAGLHTAYTSARESMKDSYLTRLKKMESASKTGKIKSIRKIRLAETLWRSARIPKASFTDNTKSLATLFAYGPSQQRQIPPGWLTLTTESVTAFANALRKEMDVYELKFDPALEPSLAQVVDSLRKERKDRANKLSQKLIQGIQNDVAKMVEQSQLSPQVTATKSPTGSRR
ncbi:hypothetical protein BCL79_3325 [Stenotrophomonas rhizophila]|uniref:Uncharacterized protein n=1 Tax=Stenotrophomonas rhizophila TaxID=216778 RepID=A0A498CAB8_9GAMM|nr:hypothetical protein [Stenotrophomonas rhizophila]RLK49840.1 hypothetical protein BCL79_3325 [Stenotrophomonas rhizophila]